MEIFDDNDMVFNKSADGKIRSAGFTVDSILMQNGNSAFTTKNSGMHTGGSVADLFKDLAVPAGLAFFNRKAFGGDLSQSKIKNDDETVSDDLHNNLLHIVEFGGEARPKKTIRNNITASGKTKKRRPNPIANKIAINKEE
jgi:hypothetical protein